MITVRQCGLGAATCGDPGPVPDGEVSYVHLDAIGSVRAITDRNGQEVARYDYLPFGATWLADGGDGNSLRFAGKERDMETAFNQSWQAFDYFGGRHFQSQVGRFTTTDPVLEVEKAILDPQRWNRYGYARNNPFRYTDPDGRSIKLATLAVKVAQAVYKKQDVYSTVERIVDATGTLISSDPSIGRTERLGAAVTLAGELSGVSDLFKAGKAAFNAVEGLADGARKVPNPWGQAEKLDHRVTVDRLESKASTEFPADIIQRGTNG